MKALVTAGLSIIALSLAACASGAPSSPGTSAPAGGTGDSSTTAAPSTSSAPTTSTSAGDHLTGPFLLTFRQTGGIAGFNMVTVIDSAAKTISYGGMRNQSPSTRSISAQEVAAITSAIDNAGLSTLKGDLKSPPISDAFNYSLEIRTGGATQTMTWSDGATVPPAVSTLQQALTRVREDKFPAQPTGGGALQ